MQHEHRERMAPNGLVPKLQWPSKYQLARSQYSDAVGVRDSARRDVARRARSAPSARLTSHKLCAIRT